MDALEFIKTAQRYAKEEGYESVIILKSKPPEKDTGKIRTMGRCEPYQDAAERAAEAVSQCANWEFLDCNCMPYTRRCDIHPTLQTGSYLRTLPQRILAAGD